MKENRVLRKVVIILLVMVVVPSLFYTVSEISAYNENEELLNQAYKQQLDVILFSVNQYSWDYLNAWTSKLDLILSAEKNIEKNESSMTSLKNRVKGFIASNAIFRQISFFTPTLENIFSVSTNDSVQTLIKPELDEYIVNNHDDR